MKEKLIPSEPHLRSVEKTLLLLGSEELPDGTSVNWKDLHDKVKPYHSMYELTENVREAVREYVARKIPKLKDAVPAIGELGEEELLDALTHNWYETVEEETGGQRREVLLAEAAHVVKRIETLAERKLLQSASPEQLRELDVEPSMRDLLVDVLEISAKADPLFVRFLAFSQLSKKPPEGVQMTGIRLENDPTAHTIAELFPHETQFISERLRVLSQKEADWKKYPGGDVFAHYLETLGKFFGTADTTEAAKLYDELIGYYKEVVASGFPVLLTPTTEGHYKPPYLDPELKVLVSNSETKTEEAAFMRAQGMLAESLGEIDEEGFKKDVLDHDVRVSLVLGGFGSNLMFPGVAQEEPAYLLFLNEQVRVYDSRFPSYLDFIGNAKGSFAELPEQEKKEYIERMSRMATMLHEFGHPVHARKSEESQRLGDAPLIAIDEVKAETLWRALVPSMIEKGLVGTREQWAEAMLAVSLLYVNDQPDGDSYYSAGVYNLNTLFEKGIVTFENNKVVITDFDAYYVAMKEDAVGVLALFSDETMTERKASAWIKAQCAPNETVQKVIDFVRKASG